MTAWKQRKSVPRVRCKAPSQLLAGCEWHALLLLYSIHLLIVLSVSLISSPPLIQKIGYLVAISHDHNYTIRLYHNHDQQRSPAFGHTAKAGGSYVQPPVRVAQVSISISSSFLFFSICLFGHMWTMPGANAWQLQDGCLPSVTCISGVEGDMPTYQRWKLPWTMRILYMSLANKIYWRFFSPSRFSSLISQVSWDAETDTITPDSQLPGWVFNEKLVVKPWVSSLVYSATAISQVS